MNKIYQRNYLKWRKGKSIRLPRAICCFLELNSKVSKSKTINLKNLWKL